MAVPSGKEKKTDPCGILNKLMLGINETILFCIMTALKHSLQINVSVYIVVLLYQVFLSFSGHGQRSVGDLVCLVLMRFEGEEGHSAPLLTLNDGSDGAMLVCGVEH